MITKNAMILILITLILVVLGFGAMKYFSPASVTGNTVKDATGEVKEFTVKAFRFGYTPNEIIVNTGDKVKILIENTDVPHGIIIPEFGVSGQNELEFNASKKGVFTWYCLIPCGLGHMQMTGKLIVK